MKLSDKKIAFLGCARDCGIYLDKCIENLSRISNLFDDYRVFIIENNSIDNTKDKLKELSDNPKFNIKISNSIDNLVKHRTWRIALCRQELLKTLISSAFKPDYVIVLDLDDIGTYEIDLCELKKCFDKENWDGIFPKTTYDLWALRWGPFNFNTEEYRKYQEQCVIDLSFPKNKIIELDEYINRNGKITDYEKEVDNDGYIKVNSAFNGLGIYKYSSFIKGKYSGENIFFNINKRLGIRNNKYIEECEHVNFHYSIQNANFYINNNLIYN